MKKSFLSKKLLVMLLTMAMVLQSVGILAFADELSTAEGTDDVIADEGWTVEEVDPEEEDIDVLEAGLEETGEEADPEETEEVPADEETHVIIVFDENSVVDAGFEANEVADSNAALNLVDEIVEQQEIAVEEISSELDVDLEIKYNFAILSNAVATTVKYGDIESIENMEGVSAVIISEQHAPLDDAETNMITAGDMVGTTTTWLSGYTGAGQRIAVIDTGIDEDHPSFDGAAFDVQIAKTAEDNGKAVSDYNLLSTEEIAQVLPYLNAVSFSGASAESLYLSSKIPFAANYVDADLDINHANDKEGDHGTHVSGIALANSLVDNDGEYTTQKNNIMGVAPDAQLITMKVFGKGGGAYTEDYMAAIEDAILLKADAVNLSLGSASAGFSTETSEYINSVLDKMTSSGTVVTISAGNSGYWSESSQYGANLKEDVNLDTVGSPGSYTDAFTVASAVNSGYTGYTVVVDDQIRIFYVDGNGSGAPAFVSLDTSGDGTGTEYEYVFINGKGLATDYEGVDVTGKIAIVQRGEITFGEKQKNAEDAGAIAALVYNNTGGTITMSLDGSGAKIPCASITLAEGQAIMATGTQDPDNENVYRGKLFVDGGIFTNYEAADGFTVSDFSSRGVPDSLELKPEISAPGGNIYATRDGGTYGLMSGTSMAAPSTAGISALVIQYIKENNLVEKTGLSTRVLAQSLIMSTATPMREGNDPDGIEFSPRSQGAGLANASDATRSPAYILVGDKAGNDGKVKIELGADPEKNGNYSFSFDVYNLTDETLFYEADASVLTEELLYDWFIASVSHKLNPGISIVASDNALLYDLNEDGKVDKSDAQLLIEHVHGTTEIKRVLNYQDAFDFNDDSVVDTADVHFFLQYIKTGNTVLAKSYIAVKDKTTINVNIDLSQEDREYLANFDNGMYVDAFVYLRGDVDLSIPMLAFYGNWADSSMYEPYDYLKAYHDANYAEEAMTYTGIERTNYVTYSYAGNPAKYLYTSNMFAKDDEYLPERNAISSLSGDGIASVVFSLIRNAGRLEASVRDAETGEVYLKSEMGKAYAAYYNANQATWMNTSGTASLNWKATNADGEPLAEGTKVNVGVTAVPSYFNDVEDVAAVEGKGLTFQVPFTIDNTAPKLSRVKVADIDDITFDEDGNEVVNTQHLLSITASDNEYIAAVLVLDGTRKKVTGRYAVNQTVKAEEQVLTIEYPEELFYIYIYDYAGNYKVYRLNKSGNPDTKVPETLTITPTQMTVLKGTEGLIEAEVGSMYLLPGYDGVTFTSADESVATVDERGVVYGVNDGETVITVQTVHNGPEGEPLTAECAVKVETLSLDLHSFIWDEDGEIFWADFNVADPSNLEKVSERQDNYWLSATALDENYLLAATESDEGSAYYVLDKANGYAAEEIALDGQGVDATDIAYSAPTNIVYIAYGPYILLVDKETGTFMGALNTSKDTGGAYIAALCMVSSENLYGQYQIDYVGFVTTEGDLFWFMYSPDLGIYIFNMGSTGVSTNGVWQYNSLYYDYDMDYYFWSMYDKSNVATLYAIKQETVGDSEVATAFNLGTFPEGVWPVAGLYGDYIGGVNEYSGMNERLVTMAEDAIANGKWQSLQDVSIAKLG